MVAVRFVLLCFFFIFSAREMTAACDYDYYYNDLLVFRFSRTGRGAAGGGGEKHRRFLMVLPPGEFSDYGRD